MTSGIPLLAEGFRQAGRRMARLSGERLGMRVEGGRMVPLPEIGGLFPGDALPVCAGIVGIASGGMPEMRFLIAMDAATRRDVAAVIAGEDLAGDPRMAGSVVQEIANIAASSIANHLADILAAPVHASPPDVVCDLWGAIAGGVIASFADPGDELAVVSTEVRIDHRRRDCIACLIADRAGSPPLPRRLTVKGV